MRLQTRPPLLTYLLRLVKRGGPSSNFPVTWLGSQEPWMAALRALPSLLVSWTAHI